MGVDSADRALLRNRAMYPRVIRPIRREHGPPHLHARYGDREITMFIETGEVLGHFPPSALRLVSDWTKLHRAELLECWRLACEDKPFGRIAPLE